MNNNDLQRKNAVTLVRNMFAAALVLTCVSTFATHASAQTVTAPPTPTQITPPAGNTAFLVGHAFGSQGYACLPTNGGGTSWTVNNPRPEATLFTNAFGQPLEIITHFLSFNENPKQGIVPQ